MALNRIELDIPAGIARGLELMTGMATLARQAPEGDILWTRSVKISDNLRAQVEVRNTTGDNVRVHLMHGEKGRWDIVETLGPVSTLWGVMAFTKQPYELSITSSAAPEYPILKNLA